VASIHKAAFEHRSRQSIHWCENKEEDQALTTDAERENNHNSEQASAHMIGDNFAIICKKTRQIVAVLIKIVSITSSEVSTYLRPGGKRVGLDLRWNAA
jgi:hypothetical protein